MKPLKLSPYAQAQIVCGIWLIGCVAMARVPLGLAMWIRGAL